MTESIARERKLFLSNLIKSPAFLIRHSPSLAAVVANRYRPVLLQKVQDAHLVDKKRPPWLPHKCLNLSATWDPAVLMKRIPFWEISLTGADDVPRDIPVESGALHDIEAYFAVHRWGRLLKFDARHDGKDTKDFLSRWLASKADKSDPAWETYSSCERIANLLTWLSTVRPEDRMENIPKEIVSFLVDSAVWIFNRLEYYGETKTNNHFLNNARALVMVGSVLNSYQLFETGLAIFRSMLPRLIQPDGFLRERSSHYQLVILKWLLDSLFFARSVNGDYQDSISSLEEITLRMSRAASLICDTKGYLLSCIGDISPDTTPYDSARLLALLHPERWPLNKKEDRPGRKSMDDWHRLDSRKSTIIANFPQGEYPSGFPTHGHCDITGFVWLYGGRQILCDSGRYRYTKDDVSAFQRSAMGHNVPVVDGIAPVCENMVSSNWVPTPYGKAFLNITMPDEHSLTMSHDGFARGGKVKKHSREIVLFDRALHVKDSFDGNGTAEICFFWHFAPGFEPVSEGSLTVRDNNLRIHVAGVNNADAPYGIEWFKGTDTGGWYSEEYGRCIPINTLVLKWNAVLPFEIKTSFRVEICAA